MGPLSTSLLGRRVPNDGGLLIRRALLAEALDEDLGNNDDEEDPGATAI
jgi:hypothetical protein